MNSFESYLKRQSADQQFTYETESVAFENKNRKRFVLLVKDLHKCLEALYKNGALIDQDFQGDWRYDESKYRKTLGQVFEPLQPNTVSTSLGSQTPNTVRILELYAGYLLGINPPKDPSTPELLKPERLEIIFSSEGQRHRFAKWLEASRGLSSKSIRHYTGTIAGKLSELAGIDLFTLQSSEALADVAQKIETAEEFSKANNQGHQMYSSALNRYREYLDATSSGQTPKPFSRVIGALSDYSICEALLSKPFTILTGASGTGKTKLAISLAKYLSTADASNYEIVAVGADWTDNRNVLGFVNHLNTDEMGPRYQSTPILDLLLRANQDPDVPYFLILDEMNLSHVERYFADFLSAMEQKNGPLKLHSESGDLRRSGQSEADVPPELDYPDNLFVIGTVNIDETTYMFSPKVLDRANVIEFTVSEEEIGAFLREPHAYPEIEPAEPGVAEGFLQLAKQAREIGCDALPQKPATQISGHLLDLFKILKAERFEFAYRTAKEINIYMQVCRHLAENKEAWDNGDWCEDLDDQILQKLLPKLHGSVGRIGKLLAGLAHYCQSGEHKADAPLQLDAAAQLKKIDTTPFPKSLAKLQSMIRTLRDEQFVSFIQ